MSINLDETIKLFSDENSFPANKKLIKTFLKTIKNQLVIWTTLSIHWFWEFSVTDRKPKIGVNPRTWKLLTIPQRKTARLKFSRILTSNINHK